MIRAVTVRQHKLARLLRLDDEDEPHRVDPWPTHLTRRRWRRLLIRARQRMRSQNRRRAGIDQVRRLYRSRR